VINCRKFVTKEKNLFKGGFEMRKKFLLFPIGVCLVLALVALPIIWVFAGPSDSDETEEMEEEEMAPAGPKTVKIGYLAPLTGPAAMWGIPPITGVKIWQSRVNDEGGLDVGGEKYMVDVVYYDDEMTGSKALEGAKKLVLVDDVKMMTVMSGPPATAVLPFTTEQKVITFNPNVFETRPTRPYMFSAGDNWPFCDSMQLVYYAQKYPGRIKRVAFTCQDDYLGYYGLSIVKAFAEVQGIEVVYDTLFSTSTTDFAPIMSAVLATDPDLISFGGIWGDFRAALIEQAYLQGVKPGEILWHASEFLLTADLEKVPP
jgi:branched-chain amino acid transport system substrate-binding protein